MRLALLALLLGAPALAADVPAVRASRAPSPWDRTFGVAAYATGWHGSYGAGGVGGRVRVEPWRYLGVDLFGEALLVTTPFGVRHDHPIGFHLYVPFRLSERVRLRPLLGMCVVASFIEPAEPHAPRADDVLVGAHLGGGVDLALHSRLSFFAEAKAVLWVGHDRTVQGWTGAVGNQVMPFVVGQGQVGFTVHFGER
ncbi:MAG: hypothetical protein AMXMBFR34_03340 [Myxococcaceae bacterium]